MKFHFRFYTPSVPVAVTPPYIWEGWGTLMSAHAPGTDLFRNVYFVGVIMYSLAPARRKAKVAIRAILNTATLSTFPYPTW